MSRNKLYRQPRYTIDHEGLQRVSQLGTIDPSTGIRHVWHAEAAIDFLRELEAQPGFTRERYCNRCDAYDGELAIKPWNKTLPWEGRGKIARKWRRKVRNIQPVALPWENGKPEDQVRLKGWHKSRPGQPMTMDSCHMCLLSFLDEQELPDLSPAQCEALKEEFYAARAEVARLNKCLANEANGPELLEYAEKLLHRARHRLRKAADACRDAGFEPARPKVVRIGDDPPEF